MPLSVREKQIAKSARSYVLPFLSIAGLKSGLMGSMNGRPVDHRRESLRVCAIVRLPALFPVADEANCFEDA
jgi:hypothetical protein